jgi:D-alanine transaminase
LENGHLTEGSSTTVHVIKNGVIHTPPNGQQILPGTTRDVVTELADLLSIRNSSAPISEAALRDADEIWLAFSTRGVLPVTRLDAAPVGGGSPGPVFKRLHLAFANYIRELAKAPPL